MNKLLAISISVATLFPSLAFADAQELMTAISSGKAAMDVRLRTEWVDFTTTKEATAITVRSTLAYKTADYQGFTGFIQFEDVTNLGKEDYNSTLNGKTQYGTIADPSLTQVNQVFIEAYGAKVGRQKIVYDNARFVGDVAWRQNDQTFDAVTYTNKVLIPSTTLNLGYVNKIHNIVGKIIPVSAPMLNVRYSHVAGDFGVNASAFYYGVEYDAVAATNANVAQNVSPAGSFQHIGTKIDGSFKDFLYEVSFAQQSEYADATPVGTPDANYIDLQLGYNLGPVTIKLQQELLEKGFKTPLATLHAFNGWADKFLITPVNGLEDTNIKVLAKYAGLNVVLAGHSFKTDTDSITLGTELNFSVAKNINKNLSVMLKGAVYEADTDAKTLTTDAGLKTDTKKGWVQAMYKF
ncbi:hypothetical protein [Agitococcus lubricus]|uniref:Alginate export protein n=1 Tax=Agitococcus lubricus TaxID=1077255 RepID=A0A2T5IVG5_9GAMM|nr:hypothetical protein [Agitococcus lubricus]PTQ87890.1 hypothetical protein C8N29_11656 [Agitococcus lubricus]